MTDYLPSAIPTPRQLQFQDWELGLFIHFGIRTFYQGHRDWDGKEMVPAAFNPTALDCGQWAETAKAVGMRYLVMTAKHHDGFALWPSKYTEFSVANSPWRDGRGDVVREFVAACREHGLHPGLYYSPAEWGNPAFAEAKAYDDYFIDQVSEILTQYGEIEILWFDGCGSENHEYDWARIIGEIRRLQPRILLFNLGDPDFRWVGNEAGVAPRPCWNTSASVPFSIRTEAQLQAVPRWLPAECDCMLRYRNWFYSDDDEDTVKSLQQLMGMYDYSVGRGCNLLINVGPDRRGLLPAADAARLREFGAAIQVRFANPLLTLADFEATENGWEWAAPSGQRLLVTEAVMAEDLCAGERVRRFSLLAWPEHSSHPIEIYAGCNIGHKAICTFPSISAHRLRLQIDRADDVVNLRTLAFFG